MDKPKQKKSKGAVIARFTAEMIGWVVLTSTFAVTVHETISVRMKDEVAYVKKTYVYIKGMR